MSKSFKKIITTGGNGMVGSQVGFGIRLNKKQLDILSPLSIQKAIQKYKPDAILHLAAMTDMLACQNNPKQAYNINVTGAKNIAKVCQKNNIKLVYLSTCAVFDGKNKSPYKETDKPNPLNVYGKTKLQGEKAVMDVSSRWQRHRGSTTHDESGSGHNNLIIRTGWLFGGGAGVDKKFVFSTFQKIRSGLEVKATSDRFGSPTYIPDLLKTVEKLIQKNARGVFHVVNEGAVSYFEIAREIIKDIEGSDSSILIPVKAFDIENPKVKRGQMEALASSKIKLRSWKKPLKEYIDILQKG